MKSALALAVAVQAVAGSLLVSEFLPDPAAVADAEGEFIEIVNAGQGAVSLEGWSLQTGATPVRLSGGNLDPGAYFVVGRSDSTANGGFHVDQIVPSQWSLPNAAGVIRLVRPDGSTGDSLAYGGGWPLSAGRSVERCDWVRESQDPATWASSDAEMQDGDYATPGTVNSVDTARRSREAGLLSMATELDSTTLRARAAVVNRGREPILQAALHWHVEGRAIGRSVWSAAPSDTTQVVVELPRGMLSDRFRLEARLDSDERPGDDVLQAWAISDRGRILVSEMQAAPRPGEPEWIELEQIIAGRFEIEGWTLGDGEVQRVLPGEAVLGAGGYLVIARDCAQLRSFYGLSEIPCATLSPWPDLAQNGDRVVLRDDQGATRDSVEWDKASWGAWPEGRTRERIARDTASIAAASWRVSASSRGGTPGQGAAPAPGWSDAAAAEVELGIEDRLFSPDGDGTDDTLLIRCRAPADWMLSIDIYDVDRHRVRRLWNGPPPPSGVLGWDGRRTGGETAPLGVYLVVIQGAAKGARAQVRRAWCVLGKRL